MSDIAIELHTSGFGASTHKDNLFLAGTALDSNCLGHSSGMIIDENKTPEILLNRPAFIPLQVVSQWSCSIPTSATM